MGIFNPAEMLASMFSSMGIDPAVIVGELNSFKAGMQATILHFDARLKTLEAQQQDMQMLLREILARLDTEHHAPRDAPLFHASQLE